tara:strand:+ start:219 stop:452 length:234 start_codon:yes stop_codon:yes gene_type:complete
MSVFSVGQVYSATIDSKSEASLTVIQRTTDEITARVKIMWGKHQQTTTRIMPIQNHTNADGVNAECVEVGGRLVVSE